MKKLFILLFLVFPALGMQERIEDIEYFFMEAVMQGDEQNFNLLLPKINIASLQRYGGTPALTQLLGFWIKSFPSINKMTLILLEKGADVNAKTLRGTTAIQKAALMFNTEMVAELLRRNADPNIRDLLYGNALSVAISSRVDRDYETYKNVIEQLLVAKANSNDKGFENRTPLQALKSNKFYITLEQQAEIRELLIRHGAKE